MITRTTLEAKLRYHQVEAARRTGGMKLYHNQQLRLVCAELAALPKT